MAKKKGRVRTRTRTVIKRVRSGARRAKPIAGLMAAGLYGAGRARLSQLVSPLTRNIPLGNISDEVGMMIVNMGIKRFVGNKIPIVGKAAEVGMFIEAAQIGQALASGQLGIGNANNTTSKNDVVIVGGEF